MATALVRVSPAPREYRRLVNGRWMVASFATVPPLKPRTVQPPAPR